MHMVKRNPKMVEVLFKSDYIAKNEIEESYKLTKEELEKHKEMIEKIFKD
jgi:hypothetical protein